MLAYFKRIGSEFSPVFQQDSSHRALNTAKPLEPENRDFLFPDVGIREQPTAELNAVTTRRKIQKVEYEMRVHKIGKTNSD